MSALAALSWLRNAGWFFAGMMAATDLIAVLCGNLGWAVLFTATAAVFVSIAVGTSHEISREGS